MDKVSAELKPLPAPVRKLALEPATVSQSDADAVFAAGRDAAAYHSPVACTARVTFMSKIIHGHGFIPMSARKPTLSTAPRRATWRLIRSWRKSEALD